MLIALVAAARAFGMTSCATPSEISRGPHFNTPARISRLASVAPPYMSKRDCRITLPGFNMPATWFASASSRARIALEMFGSRVSDEHSIAVTSRSSSRRGDVLQLTAPDARPEIRFHNGRTSARYTVARKVMSAPRRSASKRSFVVAVTMRSPTGQQQNRRAGAQQDSDTAQSQQEVPASSQAPQQISQIISVCINQSLKSILARAFSSQIFWPGFRSRIPNSGSCQKPDRQRATRTN